MINENSKFGEVQGLLAQTPSPKAWLLLCDLLEDWEDEEELEQSLLPYVVELLEPWHDAFRVVPFYWIEPWIEGERVPHLAMCRTLDLRCQHFLFEDVEALVQLSELEHIHILNLAYNGLQDMGTEVLMKASFLKNVRTLDLAGNSVGIEGVEAICASPFMKHLECLDLTGNWVNDYGAMLFSECETLPKLDRLILRGNPVYAEGAAALAASSSLPESIKINWRGRA